jgi:hypothetical protein
VPASTTTGRTATGERDVRARATAPASPIPQPDDSLPLLVRCFDVLFLLVATAPALVLGAPVLGYAIGAGAWLVQRLLAVYDGRLIERFTTRFGVSLFEAFGRIWLLAGAIVLAGVAGGRADGLTAAVTIFVAYSIAFALRIIGGRPQGAQRG